MTTLETYFQESDYPGIVFPGNVLSGKMTIRETTFRETSFREKTIRESNHPGNDCKRLGHMEPHFGGSGGRRESAMAPLERAMVASYRLSIVTVALSVTIRPQFAIECLRRSNQQGVGHFGPKFSVPLGADPSCWGCKE